MQYQVESVDLSVEVGAQIPLTAMTDVAQPVEINIGRGARINVEQAVTFVKSGVAEIESYVANKTIPEIGAYVEDNAKPLVKAIIEEQAAPVVSGFVEGTVMPELQAYTDTSTANMRALVQEATVQAQNATTAATAATDAKDDAVAAKNYAESAINDTNLVTVATDLRASSGTIKTVANNITNVNTVAGIASSVTAVTNNAANINAVNANKNNINIVAEGMGDIYTVADNIEDIQMAYFNATMAKEWAIKMNGLVYNEDYSSKYYAQQAKNYAESVDPDNLVHLTGDETITGTKTFTQNLNVTKNGASINLSNSNFEQGNPPDSNEVNSFVFFKDKNGVNVGSLKCAYRYDGVGYTQLIANKHDGSAGSPTLGIYCDDGNKGYTACPASDVNGSIVTTVNKSKATNGYVQFGNGVIINWGKTFIGTSSQKITVTFSKAYSNNNAPHVAVEAGGQDMPKVSQINSTSFVLSREPAEVSIDNKTYTWIAVGY